MKKALLILVCLLTAVLLSSCHIHIDTDPWPASPDYADPASTATPDEAFSVTEIPQQPEATGLPATEDIAPTVTPTPEPSNEVVEPGFNG